MGRFGENVNGGAVKLTPIMLHIFHMVVEKLPPTPSKFHYIFNLRDLGRVCEGLCMATPDKVTGEGQLARLWRNEMTRVFGDRLTTTEDQALLSEFIHEGVSSNFSVRGTRKPQSHARGARAAAL